MNLCITLHQSVQTSANREGIEVAFSMQALTVFIPCHDFRKRREAVVEKISVPRCDDSQQSAAWLTVLCDAYSPYIPSGLHMRA